MRIAKCRECGAVIEIDGGGSRSVEKTANGYQAGSKGDFIARLIQDAGDDGIAKIELQKACLEKFDNDSLPRINHVIYDLKKLNKVVTKDGKVHFIKEPVAATTDDAAPETEEKPKAEADPEEKPKEEVKEEVVADPEEKPKAEADPTLTKAQRRKQRQKQQAREH